MLDQNFQELAEITKMSKVFTVGLDSLESCT